MPETDAGQTHVKILFRPGFLKEKLILNNNLEMRLLFGGHDTIYIVKRTANHLCGEYFFYSIQALGVIR
jgi:hypothetical protein